MARVLALFDDEEAIERAKGELEERGADGDVVRVFLADGDRTGKDESPERRAAAHVVSQQGEVAATGSPTGSAADLDLDPLGEVGDYFRRAHQEGAHLVVAEAEDPGAAAEMLAAAGAQRVHVA